MMLNSIWKVRRNMFQRDDVREVTFRINTLNLFLSGRTLSVSSFGIILYSLRSYISISNKQIKMWMERNRKKKKKVNSRPLGREEKKINGFDNRWILIERIWFSYQFRVPCVYEKITSIQTLIHMISYFILFSLFFSSFSFNSFKALPINSWTSIEESTS